MILALVLTCFASAETFQGPCSSQKVLQPGKYSFVCFGAQGGGGKVNVNGQTNSGSYGGKGAKTNGTLNLKGNHTFYFTAGGMGESVIKDGQTTTEGGFNGGGRGFYSSPHYAGGGGGASDIRIDENKTDHRIIVAAGGSGGAGKNNGAPGGDITGITFISNIKYKPSESTNQIEGGEDGQGQDGNQSAKGGGSGGGGGYFGGVAGTGNRIVSDSGSSYIAGYENCTNFTFLDIKFEDSHMVANETNGDGQIILTQICECPLNCYSCATSDNCTKCDECDIHYEISENGSCIPEEANPTLNFSSSSLFSNSDPFSFSQQFSNSKYFSQSQPMSSSISFSASDYFSKSEQFLATQCFSSSDAFSNSQDYSDSAFFTKSGLFSETNDFSNSAFFTKSGLFSETNDFSSSAFFTNSVRFSETDDFSNSKQFTQSIMFSNSQYFSYSELFSDSIEFSMSQTNLPKDSHQDPGDLESSNSEINNEESSSSEDSSAESSNNDNNTTDVEDSSFHSFESEIPNSQSENRSKSNNISIILGIVSSIVGIGVIILILIFVFKRNKPKEETPDMNEFQSQARSLGETTSISDLTNENEDDLLSELNDPFVGTLEEAHL